MTTKRFLAFARMKSILCLGIFYANDNINNNVFYVKKEGLISLLVVGQQLFKRYSRKRENDSVQLGFSSQSKGPIWVPGKAIKPQSRISIKRMSTAGC